VTVVSARILARMSVSVSWNASLSSIEASGDRRRTRSTDGGACNSVGRSDVTTQTTTKVETTSSRPRPLRHGRDILVAYSLNYMGLTQTPTPTSSPTSPFSLPRAGHARQSSPTCPPTRPTRALFLAKLSVRGARLRTCKRVHDKLSCTRLENYTIDASVSVSVSVPWNLSLPVHRLSRAQQNITTLL